MSQTKIFLLIALFTCPLLQAQESVSPADLTEPVVVNVKDETTAQIFRNARELFLRGDLANATQAFQRMLTIDCSNALAQYHLQKIAEKDQTYAYLNDLLDKQACPRYDFTEEDFLPASLYYEQDVALILEQLAAYNERYRSAKSQLNDEITRSSQAIASLEAQVATLETQLEEARKAPLVMTEVQEEIKTVQATATQEITLLQETSKKLTFATEARRKELLKLNTRLTEARDLRTKANQSDQQQFNKQLKTVQNHLDNKETLMAQKTSELTTLEAKFANIQQRLTDIKAALTTKNATINELTNKTLTIKE